MERNIEAIDRLAATKKSHKARQRFLVALQEQQQQGGPITLAAVYHTPMSRKHFCTISVRQIRHRNSAIARSATIP